MTKNKAQDMDIEWVYQNYLDNHYIVLNNGVPVWLTIASSRDRAITSFLGLCGHTTSWDERDCEEKLKNKSKGSKIRRLSEILCRKENLEIEKSFEKCGNCGKNLAGFAILTTLINGKDIFCSRECWDEWKKES